MFARLSIHFSLSLISFVSLIATQSLADNLFTDWTTSDLNDATPNNINNDQLLAFNNEPSSNMFTSDSLTTNPLNQAPTEPSLDTSNMFPDSTSLDSLDTITLDSSVSNDQPALLNLPNDPLGVDAMSPDLLADNVSGACSLPSSSSRRSRKRQSTEAVCSDSSYGASGEIEAAKKGFFEKTTEAKNEAYKRIVCPSAHYGAAVTIPVCSSPDPLKNAWMGALSPIYPHSETLADSKLLLWLSADLCLGASRRPYCCQEWVANLFSTILLDSDPRFDTGTGYNCFDMSEEPTVMQKLGLERLGLDKMPPPRGP